jgi:RNA polymerase sigma-70 factor, ECF subfamily
MPQTSDHEATAGPGGIDLERLVEAHGAAIARYAWGFADSAADHADLLQEIMIALWQALPRFRGESSLWTFTFRVAHNRALSFAGRQRRHRSVPIPRDAVDLAPGPEAGAELRARRERLMVAVRRLPAAQRQVVMLHLEGASPSEIAAVQGISQNNASVRLTRARGALRSVLKDGER